MSATANKTRLVLLRKKGETILIGEGKQMVSITINYIKKGSVSLVCEGSRNISIDRLEHRLQKGAK